jgi:hypothetical protein
LVLFANAKGSYLSADDVAVACQMIVDGIRALAAALAAIALVSGTMPEVH